MKTYGQINLETIQMFEAHGDLFAGLLGQPQPRWRRDSAIEAIKGVHEAGAQAVIEEFKRRHNIAIPPEED